MDTLFAGTLSALTVDIAIYPLDTLKSRLQDPKRHIHFPDGKGMSKGLYQGIGPVLVASLPAGELRVLLSFDYVASGLLTAFLKRSFVDQRGPSLRHMSTPSGCWLTLRRHCQKRTSLAYMQLLVPHPYIWPLPR